MPEKVLPRVLESISFLDEKTIEVRYKPAVNVTLDDMREILNHVYAFTQNKRLKRLIVISKDAQMELPARLFLQQENKDRQNTIIAEAVLVTSLTQKMTTNFYLKFIKDSYPSKFFTDYNKAKEWLDAQTATDY
ncbi:MAG: hypothetical protein ACKOXF_08075 [Chitinophagaceae bacterium]